jgi:hypothetical protein
MSNSKPPSPENLIQLGLPARISRRQAMQWVLAAAGAAGLPAIIDAAPIGQDPLAQKHAAAQPAPSGAGYGTDPNITALHRPGDFWPLTFTNEQRKLASVLADTILPTDQYGPAASEVGVVEMLDEWISAPYPQQRADRPIVLDGLAWLEAEGHRRHGVSFFELKTAHLREICDDICYTRTAKTQFRKAAGFFGKFRSLCASAYYATPQGWKAIGYVGNVALPSFDGPPAEVLERLGVTQTVK